MLIQNCCNRALSSYPFCLSSCISVEIFICWSFFIPLLLHLYPIHFGCILCKKSSQNKINNSSSHICGEFFFNHLPIIFQSSSLIFTICHLHICHFHLHFPPFKCFLSPKVKSKINILFLNFHIILPLFWTDLLLLPIIPKIYKNWQ